MEPRQLITPVVGKTYLVNHSSRRVEAKCVNVLDTSIPSYQRNFVQSRAFKRYYFYNPITKRTFVLKSRVPILREISKEKV